MFKKTLVAALLVLAAALPAEVAAQTTPGKPVAEKVSLDTLASLPLMSDLQMSPGGTKIAMTLGAGNEFGYAVLDLSKPGSKPQIFARASTFKEAGQRDVTSYRWVDDRYLILELASREFVAAFGQRVDIQRLAAYDTGTGKTHPLAWDQATADASNILHIDKEKKRILLGRQIDDGNTERMFSYQVDWVDVATGKVLENVQRTNPIVDGWAADGDGVVRMGFGSDRDSGEQRDRKSTRLNSSH